MSPKKLQNWPFTLFLVGVLTGVLIVGLLFLYKLYISELGSVSLFKNFKYYSPIHQYVVPKEAVKPSQSSKKSTTTNPISTQDPDPW